MKIVSVESLVFPEIKIVTLQRFPDHRGYFAELFRRDDFDNHPLLKPIFGQTQFVQINENFSRKGTIRGMHIQWNPRMGKLVRTAAGHMVDIVMDMRLSSTTFGKMIAFDMPNNITDETDNYIWVPEGFAHGNYYLEDSKIVYYVTANWNPACEASISPIADDIDWSLCDKNLYDKFKSIADNNPLMTDKDKNGYTLATWKASKNAGNFK